MMHAPNEYRIGRGRLASDESYGNNGAFRIPYGVGRRKVMLTVIASDGDDWEHVSVSTPRRCPTWEEMDHVKRLFWDDDDAVMQLHAPRADHVNNHEYCLHLWRPLDEDLPLPPTYMVGDQRLGTIYR